MPLMCVLLPPFLAVVVCKSRKLSGPGPFVFSGLPHIFLLFLKVEELNKFLVDKASAPAPCLCGHGQPCGQVRRITLVDQPETYSLFDDPAFPVVKLVYLPEGSEFQIPETQERYLVIVLISCQASPAFLIAAACAAASSSFWRSAYASRAAAFALVKFDVRKKSSSSSHSAKKSNPSLSIHSSIVSRVSLGLSAKELPISMILMN